MYHAIRSESKINFNQTHVVLYSYLYL